MYLLQEHLAVGMVGVDERTAGGWTMIFYSIVRKHKLLNRGLCLEACHAVTTMVTEPGIVYGVKFVFWTRNTDCEEPPEGRPYQPSL